MRNLEQWEAVSHMAKAQPQTLDYVPAEQKNNMIIETHVVKGILKKHPGKVKKLFFFFSMFVHMHLWVTVTSIHLTHLDYKYKDFTGE